MGRYQLTNVYRDPERERERKKLSKSYQEDVVDTCSSVKFD